MGNWRRHDVEFKRQVVERMKTRPNIQELARELGLERKLMYSWKYQFEGRPEKKHANYGREGDPNDETARLRKKVEDLERALGRKTAEADFFATVLRKVEQDRQARELLGEPASTPRSKLTTPRSAPGESRRAAPAG